MNKNPLLRLLRYIFLYGALVLLSIFLGYVVQNFPIIKTFDNYFYVHINGLPHPKNITNLISPFDLWFLPYPKIFFLPAYFYFLIGGMLLYLAIFRRTVLIWGVLTLLLGLLLAGILLEIDWHFIFRHRPFESLPSTVDAVSRQALMKFPSYPSGHVRDTTVVSTILAHFIPKLKWPLIIFVLFIAFTRVYTGAHFPTDAIAGIIFGFFTAKIAIGITSIRKRK